MSTHATIVRLLESLGSQKEVRQYLQHYGAADARKLAVIKVSGDVLDAELDALADALGFLTEVRLQPVVIHGAGEQLATALDAAGAVKDDSGRRIINDELLEVARRTIQGLNLALVDALGERQTPARPLTSGVLTAAWSDTTRLYGAVASVDEAPIRSALRAGQLPVIAPLAETARGQIVTVDADDAARALARTLQPHKAIVLTRRGGVYDAQGALVPAINLAEDLTRLRDAAKADDGLLSKLEELAALVDVLPDEGSVSVTSPRRLPRELFTHRGAGTLVRRGEAIQRFDSFGDVDVGAVRALLERCFGRPLAPDYFETKRPRAVYVADAHRAVAVVTEEEGVPYLDKFAVTTEAQGAGVGASLWRRMKVDHPALFWRSRRANPINGWYFQQADGSVKGEDWVVFWTGLTAFDAIGRVVERAFALPATLGDHAEGAA